MLALFEILRYSFSSVVWGVLVAVLCMALFVFLIKGWYKDATFLPISYAIGAILFLLLSFQSILIVGSLKIISMTDEYEQRISLIVEEAYSPSVVLSVPETSDVIGNIIEEFPILNYYIDGGEFTGYTAKELPHAIADELRSFMRLYIFRRILWCLGFVIVGAICVIKTLSKSYQGIKRQRVQYDRRRVSRRTRR